ncbi:proteasome assembly chaperone 2 [Anopheles ziemanni]|uniref:proteasome assembly chaperone 2 n=1 Tax=Anopheles coustani TaxID=139045 RepID=UPI00265AEBED|nr:proteasome assembly chaperone 2 [Anopheles coustani]XP_058172970.1 proteasome assembly chaperone 2 [Anopheles ziemanni]
MFSFKREFDFTGYSFIVPSVSVGNVPQLAVDVVIETLQLEPAGQVWHPALIPIVGPAAFEHEPSASITTSAELYASEERKLLVLQIRAPLVGALQKQFFELLADFVRDRKLARVFLLSSCFSHEKFDIRTGPFRYVSNEPYNQSDAAARLEDGQRWIKHAGGVIHGGGYALKLQEALTSRGVATLVFFMYVSEGDNTAEGLMLARMLHAVSGEQLLPVQADQVDVRVPKSWKHLYGTGHPRALY